MGLCGESPPLGLMGNPEFRFLGLSTADSAYLSNNTLAISFKFSPSSRKNSVCTYCLPALLVSVFDDVCRQGMKSIYRLTTHGDPLLEEGSVLEVAFVELFVPIIIILFEMIPGWRFLC